MTLFLADENEDAATARLDTAAETLRGHGIGVETVAAVGTAPFAGLIDQAPDHDAIVMGEQAPSFRSLVFGEESERVASASVGPVLVVQYDETSSE